jgi:hypothetical protein
VNAQLIEEVSGAQRPAVIPQQRLALAVQWFQQVDAVLAGGEPEALAQLALEHLEKGAAAVTTGAAFCF